MSETLPARIQDEETIDAVVTQGDLGKLTPAQRVTWYLMRCQAAGLDPRTKPFDYISLSGRLVLYANKTATDQLAQLRGLTTVIAARGLTEGEIYEVLCRVTDPGGRTSEDVGAVFVGGLKGEALANARMKALSKAKRRAILAHCGLGMTDESETESIPGAQRLPVDLATGEVLERAPEPGDAAAGLARAGRRLHAVLAEAGIDTGDRPLVHRVATAALDQVEGAGPPVTSVTHLDARRRHLVADWIQQHPDEIAALVEAAGEPQADPFDDVDAEADSTVPQAFR